MSRENEIRKQIEQLQSELDKEIRASKQDDMQRLAELANKIDEIYAEAQQLARKHDVQFYFSEGYDSVIFNKEESWNSSRC